MRNIRCLAAASAVFLFVNDLSAENGRHAVPYSFAVQQLAKADSLQRNGNCDSALALYGKLRDQTADQDVAMRAQFSIAMAYLYYDKPVANYDMALQDLKRFATLYPKTDRTELAYNWIRALTAMKEYYDGYQVANIKLNAIAQKQTGLSKNYTSLQEAYFISSDKTDSLKRVSDSLQLKIKVLEGVIGKIEKIR